MNSETKVLNPSTSIGDVKPENLVRTLEHFMSSVIGDQLTAMLDSADEILFEMAEKAGNSADQRLYFDALRVIRIERARLLRTFQDNLQHAFADGRTERAAASIDLDDLDSWSVQGDEETEETVVVANLGSKAAAMYQKELYELENRLETLAEKNSEASPKLVAPSKIFDAFRHTVKGLEVEFPIKQVIYKLAERSLLGNLRQVYTGANQMLESRGYAPSRHHSPTKSASALATPSVEDSAVTTPSSPTAWPSGMSASRLMDGLNLVSNTVGGAGLQGQSPWQGQPQGQGYSGGQLGGPAPSYTDNQLASEIGAALDAMSQGRQQSGWIPPSNIALTGQMFDSLYQDKQLSEPLRPLLRRMQFPVMKTALADPGFFKDPKHPVRKLVHEVFGMLANADSPSEQEVNRLSELIDYLLRQFDVTAERLSKPEGRAPSVSDDQAEVFLAEQKERQASHRARTLENVRRMVTQELKLRTTGRSIPETVMPLLLSGFGPLLAVNVLRGGVNGIPWKESLILLERVLLSVEPGRFKSENQSSEEADIVTSVTERLVAIGIAHEKVQPLVAALLDIYQAQALREAMQLESPDEVVPAPPPVPKISPEEQALASAQQALSAILTVGSWFQVWDAPNNQRRWLKLHAYIPARDAVVFDDFMAENHLKIHASTLIRDLIAERSAPVDPSPAVQRSLKLLAPLASQLPISPQDAIWQPAAPTTQ